MVCFVELPIEIIVLKQQSLTTLSTITNINVIVIQFIEFPMVRHFVFKQDAAFFLDACCF